MHLFHLGCLCPLLALKMQRRIALLALECHCIFNALLSVQCEAGKELKQDKKGKKEKGLCIRLKRVALKCHSTFGLFERSAFERKKHRCNTNDLFIKAKIKFL
jgi:hypothetical protein